jgi:predicted AlkP superfamily phosphohydrolase/phosphomutase
LRDRRRETAALAGRFRVALLALALGALAAPAAAGRVVVVGIDGGSWNLIDEGLARGELPAFAALAARGVTAELVTVPPVISPAVWTTIATGRSPAAHGVTHFYVTREDVRVPTAFERLAALGLRVGLYDWLVTWPPRSLPGGFVVPGWLRQDERIEPADAFARAGVTPYLYTNELETREAHAENALREAREKPARFTALVRAFDAQVAAVTFYALDEASHRFWRAAFPVEFEEPAREDERRFVGTIGETLRALDRALALIQASLSPDDHLIVVSDHGFRAGTAQNVWVTDVRAWLRASGIDPEREGFAVAGGFGRFVVRVPPGPFAEREATLERARAWALSARTPAGEPLFQVDPLDVAARPAGHERSWAEWARQLGVRAFLWWNSVELTRPAHAYLFATPRGELLDALWPDGRIRLGEREAPLAELAHPDAFSGAHDPTGILLAAGPAFRSRSERLVFSVLEVAPLLHYLAGTALPDDLERPLREDLLDAAWLAAHPPRRIEAASLPALDASPSGERLDLERTRERLRGLGYVE